MATGSVRVEGGRELRATLKEAGHDLTDLKDTHREAAELVIHAAKPPKKSGRLDASARAAGTATAAIMRWGGSRVPYAGPVHFKRTIHHPQGQPFGTEAAQRTEPTWIGLYEDRIEHIIGTIEGD